MHNGVDDCAAPPSPVTWMNTHVLMTHRRCIVSGVMFVGTRLGTRRVEGDVVECIKSPGRPSAGPAAASRAGSFFQRSEVRGLAMTPTAPKSVMGIARLRIQVDGFATAPVCTVECDTSLVEDDSNPARWPTGRVSASEPATTTVELKARWCLSSGVPVDVATVVHASLRMQWIGG